MKFTILLLLLGTLQVFAKVEGQKISLTEKNASLPEVFNKIKLLTGYVFIYTDEEIAKANSVSFSVKEVSLPVLLNEVLKNQSFSYEIQAKTVFISSTAETVQNAQMGIKPSLPDPPILLIEIKGKVADVNGLPIVGASIIIKGTQKATISDAQGNFYLRVSDKNIVLIVSFTGYKTQEIPLKNQTEVNVQLVIDVKALEDVVIVGYGVQKKATVTGAIVSMDKASLLQSPQANISNALAGRVSGVMAVQKSGRPGDDASTIRIRGIGTFAGSSDPLIMVDGIETDNYNNMDPNEIDNISILKDASATAVYGVRGANGVIIITTKRGKIGKPQVSYSVQYATLKFTNIRHSMNAFDFATDFNLARKYDSYITGGYTPAFSDAALAHYKSHDDPVFYPDVDWFPYMFDKSSGQTQHNLTMTGGTDRVKYFISLGYFDQEGLIKHTDLVKDYDATLRFKRYNIRSNFDFTITSRLTANFNLSTTIENRSGSSANIDNIFASVWSTNPVDQPLITDGKYIILDGIKSLGSNPFQQMFLAGTGLEKNYRNYLNSSLRFNYDLNSITQGLSAHATISYNNYNTQDIIYRKDIISYKAKRLADQSIIYIPQNNTAPFGFSESFGKNRKTYLEAGFDYKRKFKDHSVSALLLYNQSKRFDPDFLYLVPNGYQGIVARATYDYKSRYLAEVNMGYNGTENFAPGDRFGLFPAFSLGWVASEEKFFPKSDIFSYMKIRGSYGIVGNDQLGSIRISQNGKRFLYMPASYSYVDNMYQFGTAGSNQQGYQGSVEGPLGNSDLTWERAKKLDIGSELFFLKNKLKLTLDYFNENRDNILANKNNVPVIVAAALPAYNLGRMSNSGYEIDLAYQNTIGKLKYWVKGNFSYAHNVVKFQDEVQKPFSYQNLTGKRFGQMFGLVAEGFFNSWAEVNDANRPVYDFQNNKIQPGDVKYRDINGDGKINQDDVVPIGYSDFPEKSFGLSFGGEFKGFDFSVLFQGAANVSVNYGLDFTQPFLQGRNAPDYMVESWSQERLDKGLPIYYPHFSEGYTTNPANYQSSTLWIRDASYVRLKNAEIGYSIPEKLLKKVRLTHLRLYINGNNLITWDNMLPGADPESTLSYGTSTYPVTRTFNFGLNVKF